MKTETELITALLRVEKIIDRIKKLKNPPNEFKKENRHYRLLLEQQYIYRWILGHKGYNFIDAYEGIEEYLDDLENE